MAYSKRGRKFRSPLSPLAKWARLVIERHKILPVNTEGQPWEKTAGHARSITIRSVSRSVGQSVGQSVSRLVSRSTPVNWPVFYEKYRMYVHVQRTLVRKYVRTLRGTPHVYLLSTLVYIHGVHTYVYHTNILVALGYLSAQETNDGMSEWIHLRTWTKLWIHLNVHKLHTYIRTMSYYVQT